MANTEQFPEIFERLKQIMSEYEQYLSVDKDEGFDYRLSTELTPNLNKPAFFGGVMMHKGHIGFYLNPIYEFPVLVANLSPQLRKLLKGKSCFNIKKMDDAVIDELTSFTRECFDWFDQQYLQKAED